MNLHAFPPRYRTCHIRNALTISHPEEDRVIVAMLRHEYRTARAEHHLGPTAARVYAYGAVALCWSLTGPVTVSRS